MLATKPCANDKGGDGFIVVAVLWIVAALATLAVVYTVYLNETAMAFADHNERLQAQGLAMAAVELAVYRLTAIPDRRPSEGRFSFQEGSATVSVAFSSENGRAIRIVRSWRDESLPIAALWLHWHRSRRSGLASGAGWIASLTP